MTKKGTKTKKAAKPAAAKKPAKKPKQLKLPAEGMARKSIPEVEEAAEKYREARDTRMEHTKLEKAAKSVLQEVAKKHGVSVHLYESEDGEEYEVRYTAKTDEDIKVSKVKPPKDEE